MTDSSRSRFGTARYRVFFVLEVTRAVQIAGWTGSCATRAHLIHDRDPGTFGLTSWPSSRTGETSRPDTVRFLRLRKHQAARADDEGRYPEAKRLDVGDRRATPPAISHTMALGPWLWTGGCVNVIVSVTSGGACPVPFRKRGLRGFQP